MWTEKDFERADHEYDLWKDRDRLRELEERDAREALIIDLARRELRLWHERRRA